MPQSGGLWLAAGSTAATPLFLSPMGQKCKSIPVTGTKKKHSVRGASFWYQTVGIEPM
jgi:hypothetical protein